MTDLENPNMESDDVFEPVTPYQIPEVERLIQTLIDLVESARPVPLSASSMTVSYTHQTLPTILLV